MQGILAAKDSEIITSTFKGTYDLTEKQEVISVKLISRRGTYIDGMVWT